VIGRLLLVIGCLFVVMRDKVLSPAALLINSELHLMHG